MTGWDLNVTGFFWNAKFEQRVHDCFEQIQKKQMALSEADRMQFPNATRIIRVNGSRRGSTHAAMLQKMILQAIAWTAAARRKKCLCGCRHLHLRESKKAIATCVFIVWSGAGYSGQNRGFHYRHQRSYIRASVSWVELQSSTVALRTAASSSRSIAVSNAVAALRMGGNSQSDATTHVNWRKSMQIHKYSTETCANIAHVLQFWSLKLI